jgi:hypothetical protein
MAGGEKLPLAGGEVGPRRKGVTADGIFALRCVAREKSPMVRIEFTNPALGLPLWESQAEDPLLTLP